MLPMPMQEDYGMLDLKKTLFPTLIVIEEIVEQSLEFVKKKNLNRFSYPRICSFDPSMENLFISRSSNLPLQ